MIKEQVITRLCELCTLVGEKVYNHQKAHDCFCSSSKRGWQFDEDILKFIEEAVRGKIDVCACDLTIRRNIMYRIGPLKIDNRTFYVIRGEKGSVTYHHYDITHSIISPGSIDVHIICSKEDSNNICEWNGNVPCKCDGRSVPRMSSDDAIWAVLENEYNLCFGNDSIHKKILSCADKITSLDLADAVINKKGVIVSILAKELSK